MLTDLVIFLCIMCVVFCLISVGALVYVVVLYRELNQRVQKVLTDVHNDVNLQKGHLKFLESRTKQLQENDLYLYNNLCTETDTNNRRWATYEEDHRHVSYALNKFMEFKREFENFLTQFAEFKHQYDNTLSVIFTTEEKLEHEMNKIKESKQNLQSLL